MQIINGVLPSVDDIKYTMLTVTLVGDVGYPRSDTAQTIDELIRKGTRWFEMNSKRSIRIFTSDGIVKNVFNINELIDFASQEINKEDSDKELLENILFNLNRMNHNSITIGVMKEMATDELELKKNLK